MQPQFTESAAKALEAAINKAKSGHYTEISDAHLLWGFIQDKAGYFISIMNSLGLDPKSLESVLTKAIAAKPTYE